MVTSIFYVSVLVVLSSTLITNSHPDNILDESSSLPPFSAKVYRFAISSKLYEKLFHLSIDPSEAASAYYDAAIAFGKLFNTPQILIEQLARRVAQSVKRAFERGITPFGYFKAFVVSDEDLLRLKGVLTPENEDQFAYSYFRSIQMELEKIEPTNNPRDYIYALNNGEGNFIKSVVDLSPADVIFDLTRFIDHLDAQTPSK